MSPPEQIPTVGYVVSTWPRLSQTFVLNEVVALEKRGWRVRIFSTKDSGGEPVHAKVAQVRAEVKYLSLKPNWLPIARAHLRLAAGLRARYFRTLVRAVRFGRMGVFRRFLQAGYLADLIRREPVGHLHAHFATAPAAVAMFASELAGTPYTFTAHARDIYVDSRPGLLRAQMEGAQAVVTICEYNRRHLLSDISPRSNGKVLCIYNGLDCSEFRFRWPRREDSPPPLILAVGRLVEKKGIELLIDAAGLLCQRGRQFRVEVIGDGPLRQALETRVEKQGLGHVVKLVGAQPLEVVRAAYERAAVFALPCLVTSDGDRDGIPTVLLEAMLAGAPVLSTPVAGIPELVNSEEVGMLVKPNDARALADGLERLLRDPSLRDRIARAARTRVEKHFSIEKSANRLAALFQEGGRR